MRPNRTPGDKLLNVQTSKSALPPRLLTRLFAKCSAQIRSIPVKRMIPSGLGMTYAEIVSQFFLTPSRNSASSMRSSNPSSSLPYSPVVP